MKHLSLCHRIHAQQVVTQWVQIVVWPRIVEALRTYNIPSHFLSIPGKAISVPGRRRLVPSSDVYDTVSIRQVNDSFLDGGRYQEKEVGVFVQKYRPKRLPSASSMYRLGSRR